MPLASLRGEDIEDVVKDATAALRSIVKTVKILHDAFKNMDSILSLVDEIESENWFHRSSLRSAVGIALRSWWEKWKPQVLYTLLARARYESDHGESLAMRIEWHCKSSNNCRALP